MKKILFFFAAFFYVSAVFSQGVAINTTGAAANSNAMLDVLSTNKGVLIPRMTSAQRKAIAVTSNDVGLLVFDKERQRLYMYDGSKWIPFAIETNSGVTSQGSFVNPNTQNRPDFGYSTAIDGEYAVIGCPKNSVGGFTKAGTAQVFQNQGGKWVPVAELSPVNLLKNAQFGKSVAISGDYIVVGAPTQEINSVESGVVYVFHRTGNNWTLQQKFFDNSPASDENFGISVDIKGSTIVVGAPGRANVYPQDPGSVFVYGKNGNSWQLETELKGNDPTGDDEFGASVSLDGNNLICGAPHEDDINQWIQDCGAVYLFTRTRGIWAQKARILASLPIDNQNFGQVVSLDGNRLAATDINNRCHIFINSAFGWIFQVFITHASGNAPGFAHRILLRDTYLFISSINEDVNGMEQAGVVYIYKRNNDGNYVLLKRLNDIEPFYYNCFGTGIGFDGVNLIVGSPGSNWLPSIGTVSFFSIGD